MRRRQGSELQSHPELASEFEIGRDYVLRAYEDADGERLDNARARLPQEAARPTLLTSDPGERPIAILAPIPEGTRCPRISVRADK